MQSDNEHSVDSVIEEDVEHEPTAFSTKIPALKPELKADETSLFSIEKIHNYGKHLFLKFIDVDGEYCINISHDSRKELLLFFSKIRPLGFNHILNKHGIHTAPVINDVVDDSKQHQYDILIQTHLYHIFDVAVAETWNLLQMDTFLRFQRTKQYQNLVQTLAKKQ
eukprot:UN08123